MPLTSLPGTAQPCRIRVTAAPAETSYLPGKPPLSSQDYVCLLPHQAALSGERMLILPGKNKTTTTILWPHLKQALLNTGQDDRHRPSPYQGFPKSGSEFTLVRSLKRQTPQGYALPSFIPLGASMHPDTLPAYV